MITIINKPITMPMLHLWRMYAAWFFCYLPVCVLHFLLLKTQNKHISSCFAFRGENFLVTLRLERRLEVRRAVKGERVKKWKGEKMASPFKGERVKKWKGFYKVKKWKCEKVKRWLRPLNLSAKRQVRQLTYLQPYKLTWQLINLTTHSLTNSFVNNLNKNK